MNIEMIVTAAPIEIKAVSRLSFEIMSAPSQEPKGVFRGVIL